MSDLKRMIVRGNGIVRTDVVYRLTPGISGSSELMIDVAAFIQYGSQ